MVFLHIDPKNYNVRQKNNKVPIQELNKLIASGKDVFVLIYKEGCPPCNETRPEWSKLYTNREVMKKDVVVVDIDKDLIEHIHNLKKEPLGYPTMRYIRGNTFEDYEDSPIQTKDRSIDSFVMWINAKKKATKRNKSRSKTRNKKRSRHKKTRHNRTIRL